VRASPLFSATTDTEAVLNAVTSFNILFNSEYLLVEDSRHTSWTLS